MIAINFIKTLFNELENQIVFLTDDLEEKDYYYKPDPKTPAIGWLLGHVLIVHDFIVNFSMLGNKLFLPIEFISRYTTGSSGDVKNTDNPIKFVEDFKNLNKSVLEGLSTKQNEWLEDYPLSTKNFPKDWLEKNNMNVFALYFTHAMNHTGQILELKRKLGKTTWGR